MNEDFQRKVQIFRFMHRLGLCVFAVLDKGGHGSPSLLVLYSNTKVDYKIT